MAGIEHNGERMGRLAIAFVMLTSPNIPSNVHKIPQSDQFPLPLSEHLPHFMEKGANYLKFQEFAKTIKHDSGDTKYSHIEGIYIEDLFALKVMQQPDSNPGFVTQNSNEVSQFKLAEVIGGALGFLAHNNLAGESFSKIAIGKNISVIQSNGVVTIYTVSKILRFRAENPHSPISNFVPVDSSLKDIGKSMTSSEVFYSVYTPNKLVLQTCIDGNGSEPEEESWGRMFIIADKAQEAGFIYFGHHR